MRLYFLLALALLTACRRPDESRTIRHTHGLDRSSAELEELGGRAELGDAGAAYELYLYYSLEKHEDDAAVPWLRRAAAGRHPEGQRLLGFLIKTANWDFSGVAATRQEAVRLLLSDACRAQSDACCELAAAFESGYFGAPDFGGARAYFQRGAEMHGTMCWRSLADYLEQGKGGPANTTEAYYWISMEAQFVHPRSVSGQEISAFRERLARRVSLRDLKSVWERVDRFVAEVDARRVTLDSPPFLEEVADPKISHEGRTLAREQEAAHRARLQARSTTFGQERPPDPVEP